MKYKVVHTSPALITEVKNTELFGDCIFFAHSYYARSQGATVVYEIELDSHKVCEGYMLESDGKSEKFAIKQLLKSVTT